MSQLLRAPRRRGFTLVELLVVISIIAMLAGLLVPAVLRTRETARRAQCTQNMSQLGAAILNYETAMHRLPPGCGLTWGPSQTPSTTAPTESWSWLAYLLPYTGNDVLGNSLTMRRNFPWTEGTTTATDKSHQTAFVTQIPVFICPSFSVTPSSTAALAKGYSGSVGGSAGLGTKYTTTNLQGALTNYKAMGGTVKDMIPQAFKTFPNPPSGVPTIASTSTTLNPNTKPDGAMIMCTLDTAPRIVDVSDGMQYTILVTETAEQYNARWMIGAETILAGLPYTDDMNVGGASVTFEKNTINPLKCWAPKGFDGKYGDQSAVSANFKTFMALDYTQYAYDTTNKWCDPAQSALWKMRGPSSQHGTIVNHLMGDRTVHQFSTQMDVAVYTFLITRAGGEATEGAPAW